MVRMYSTPSGQATVMSTSDPNNVASARVEMNRARPSGPPSLVGAVVVATSVVVCAAAGVGVAPGVVASDDAVATVSCWMLNWNVPFCTLGSAMPCTDQVTAHAPLGSGVVDKSRTKLSPSWDTWAEAVGAGLPLHTMNA